MVVGYQESGAINQLAYIWRDGQYRQPVTTKEVPGILGSAATGINGRGEVVGYYFFNTPTGQIVQGFVRRAGNLAPVDLIPLGINNVGQIVGLSGAGNDGAVLEDGIVTLIKYPGADYTQVHGINNKGYIVGYYLKAGQYYGFIGKPIVKVANGNKK